MSARGAKLICGLAAMVLAGVGPTLAQQQTVGLFISDEQTSQGYTLFSPSSSSKAYLIDTGGLVVHAWETGSTPNLMGYLRENGNLVRSARQLAEGGGSGTIQEFDWSGNLVWEFDFNTAEFLGHHDIELMPNGNILMIAWEFKSAAEAIAQGRDPFAVSNEVWPDFIAELRPLPPNDAEIVWEWHVWDHLIQDLDPTKGNFGVVADHPELVDINFGPTVPDWNHVNSVSYNPTLDQIIVSSRAFSEIWVIDHSTTTAQAAGHSGGNSGRGGDLLYRWGNPQAYGRGTESDRTLFGQHDTNWIPEGYPGAGRILVYNNGLGRGEGDYSSVDEIVPPIDETGSYTTPPGAAFGPAGPIWSYTSPVPTEFYSPFLSGAQRLPNGNTLICEGRDGHLFEVTAAGEVVWDYVSPLDADGVVSQGEVPGANRAVFKMRRYPATYPAFQEKDLTPGDPIEEFITPLPITDGSLRAARPAAGGNQIQLQWDASSCTSSSYNLLYGKLSQLPTYELLGARCNLGTGGAHTWVNVPIGSVYFLVVGTDDLAIYESSWGRTGANVERGGSTASFLCGTTTKAVSATCP